MRYLISQNGGGIMVTCLHKTNTKKASNLTLLFKVLAVLIKNLIPNNLIAKVKIFFYE
jgi:hypothetical protein